MTQKNEYDVISPETASNIFHIDKKQLSSEIKNMSLRGFLEYVSENVFQISNIDAIESHPDKALDAIIDSCIATKFVGAGVGGLLINDNKNEVLLYLRPKKPEKYKWSMPGGCIRIGENAKVSLINEYKYITGIDLQSNNLLPLRITNHLITIQTNNKCKYHYLSPAFTIKDSNSFLREINVKINKERKLKESEIVDLAKKLMSGEGISEKQIEDLVNDIKSGKYFLKDWESELLPEIKSFRKYIVKWFKISDIIDSDKISIPTKKALKSYRNRTNTINELVNETKKILNDAACGTQDKIKAIKIENIIETDD